MSGYRDFADFYDRLMTDVDYNARADYLLYLFQKHDGKLPATVLDVACGSGALCEALQKRGIDPIGVDASETMLAKAAERFAESSTEILLLKQDMRELDLYGTVDGAVCVLDSVNHLCTTKDVKRFFERLRLFVKPNGLFVFDVNTPYKHREVLADNAFVFEQEEFVCVWQNHYAPRTAQTEMWLDFFVEEEDGRYCRLSDTVKERAYTEKTLRRLLAETGWTTEAVYDDMLTEEPSDDSERMVFVVRSTRTEEEALGITR